MNEPAWPLTATNANLVRGVVAENVRREREEARMTFGELERATGLAASTLKRLESGTVNPRLTSLIALSFGLRVPLGALLGGLPEPPPRWIARD